MESIITIATVLTMYFNAANDVNAPYLYNSDLEDGVIHKIEVYEQKSLQLRRAGKADHPRGDALGREQEAVGERLPPHL